MSADEWRETQCGQTDLCKDSDIPSTNRRPGTNWKNQRALSDPVRAKLPRSVSERGKLNYLDPLKNQQRKKPRDQRLLS